MQDGVIKFHCEWIQKELPPSIRLDKLNETRQALFAAGFIGVDSDGIGYGNLSSRLADSGAFVITGTQTGNLPKLTKDHYTLVTDYDIEKNFVRSEGPIKASSESLTHASIYQLDSAIQAIIHIHQLVLWKTLLGQIPTSRKEVPYGTPEMAREVKRLYREADLGKFQILAMAGHEAGIITFGRTLEGAQATLFQYAKR